MAASVGTSDADEPLVDLNTTPLIDVMLVLLVMFIITIPIQTHAVKIDLPVNSNTPPPPIQPDVNKLTITPAGVIQWNGSGIDLATLRTYLDTTKTMAVAPELHIEPDANSQYAIVDEVIAVVKKSKVEKVGFVGNERYANFSK